MISLGINGVTLKLSISGAKLVRNFIFPFVLTDFFESVRDG